ncbi:hypothetical protein L873DRAFT_1839984 [Choiromyces venosus 120613-1]|uniref:Uncharacterized protein n=1 Tax=Choiromyces venosus 120613-1 TaxID=1336337 RepID=A0A3N4KAN4_9PEZI|nr:hypothetical protein L873DRAFT_1839984 [Choiromyces venosus 120613-1]
MLMEARRKSLTDPNIRATFRYTRIAPFNQRQVLMSFDLQNLTPPYQNHHNLQPQASSTSPASQIQKVEEEMKRVDSLDQAREIVEELSSIAKSATTQYSVGEKQYSDELIKRKASKSKAGAIISRSEVIGRKALDDAYNEKIAKKEKAKQTAEKRKRKGENSRPRRRKYQHIESELGKSSIEEEEDVIDIAGRRDNSISSSRVPEVETSAQVQPSLDGIQA